MLAEHDIGSRESLERPGGDHGLRSGAVLLGRLEDRDDRARPFVLGREEALERAEEARHVHVVTARVHDGHVGARRVGAARGARVLEAGQLLHRERVHVGTEPDDRTISVADDADHAGLADALFELDAQLAQRSRDDTRRPRLLERQFGMPVQVGVEGFEVDGHAVEPSRGAVMPLRGCVRAGAQRGQRSRRAVVPRTISLYGRFCRFSCGVAAFASSSSRIASAARSPCPSGN